MIADERALQAAKRWIEYWKSTRTLGQSWIGNEQASQKIAELRRQIDAYHARQRGSAAEERAADPAISQQPSGQQ